MKQILANHLGKNLVIHYGASSVVKGKLIDLADGVAQLEGEEATFFVAIDKIHVFWEEEERDQAMGFVTKPATPSS